MTSRVRIKTPAEIIKLHQGGIILSNIIGELVSGLAPGQTTLSIDKKARQLFASSGTEPSFLGFGQPPYPASICVSVNDTVVHGVPSSLVLKEGDIVGIDAGLWHEKLCTDMAITVGIGKISAEAEKLITITKQALQVGLDEIAPGCKLGNIGYAIQELIEQNDFSVVRDLMGHGVGYAVHEAPSIPNFGHKNVGMIMEEGMVLAIEPMVNTGHWSVKLLANDWDIVTEDGGLSAHFEQTVVVTKKGYQILTPWPENLKLF